MQRTPGVCSPGDIIDGRYRVERILGQGGFSTVYLVCDLGPDANAPEAEQHIYALKVLHNQDRMESVRLRFEGHVLTKLRHPALPRVHVVHEGNKEQRPFLVLDYIEGTDLEALRKGQPDKKYAMQEVITLLAYIVDALNYLHQQQPAVIHRDIKPANILVAQSDQRAYLIDFGIAKEYEVDATTAAIRHGTPGYGAPEQYGTTGTDTRTDLYALGATCYCLLTGVTPLDALQRMTHMVRKKVDPLPPVSELAPEVPAHVSQAIQRAMAIDDRQRFASVQEFWEVLKEEVTQPDGISFEDDVPTQPGKLVPAHLRHEKRTSPLRQLVGISRGRGRVISSIVLIVLFAASSLGFWSYIDSNGYLSLKAAGEQAATPTAIQQSSPTPDARYPRLALSYKGQAYNVGDKIKNNITLSQIKQNNQALSGRFTGLRLDTEFTGILDDSRHIYLTIPTSDAQKTLHFSGTVRADGYLVGDFCTQDAEGQCKSNHGVWSVTPLLDER